MFAEAVYTSDYYVAFARLLTAINVTVKLHRVLSMFET